MTWSSDLAGFPDVTWENHFAFEVSGAAATPDGRLYLCHGPFTTELYESTLEGPPQYLSTISEDMSALAFGRGTLFGYSNYAPTKGIYEIDPSSGVATLLHDIYTGTGFRFFGLTYNAADDKLYGYTEYGTSGLYGIDIGSGAMNFVVGPIPASNSQGRGLAAGGNTIYVTATRGDDGIPYYAYDLSQGSGGVWAPFTNPYPAYHSTGGAAWIPDPAAGLGGKSSRTAIPMLHLGTIGPNPMSGVANVTFDLLHPATVEVAVFDIIGRRVRLLMAGTAGAGRHAIGWDGHNACGERVAAGSYFVRIRTHHDTASRRLTVLGGAIDALAH
jgi:hypothetical protein